MLSQVARGTRAVELQRGTNSPDICSFHLQHLRVDVIVCDPLNMTIPHLRTDVSRNQQHGLANYAINYMHLFNQCGYEIHKPFRKFIQHQIISNISAAAKQYPIFMHTGRHDASQQFFARLANREKHQCLRLPFSPISGAVCCQCCKEQTETRSGMCF